MTATSRVGRTLYERAIMLDSGPLISLYDPNDTRGDQVAGVLEYIRSLKYPVFTTILTIAEVHRLILYNVGYKRALEFLRAIYDGTVRILEIESQDASEAIEIVEKYSTCSISFADAVSMALMKRLGILQIMSYDHHFWTLNFYIPPEIYGLRSH